MLEHEDGYDEDTEEGFSVEELYEDWNECRSPFLFPSGYLGTVEDVDCLISEHYPNDMPIDYDRIIYRIRGRDKHLLIDVTENQIDVYKVEGDIDDLVHDLRFVKLDLYERECNSKNLVKSLMDDTVGELRGIVNDFLGIKLEESKEKQIEIGTILGVLSGYNLYQFLKSYDEYIQGSNYEAGWKPLSLVEYYTNEWKVK